MSKDGSSLSQINRVCFDIDSSYFYSSINPWIPGPAEAREYWQGKSITFYAATAYLYSTKQYVHFIDPKKLFECLAGAEEIISFNGRKCDLIVLEHVVGEEAATVLWRKPHHDLTGWRGIWRLKEAISSLSPSLPETFDSPSNFRYAELREQHSDFIAGKLAGTHRDVKFTCELFERYLASGDTSSTFRDLD